MNCLRAVLNLVYGVNDSILFVLSRESRLLHLHLNLDLKNKTFYYGPQLDLFFSNRATKNPPVSMSFEIWSNNKDRNKRRTRVSESALRGNKEEHHCMYGAVTYHTVNT